MGGRAFKNFRRQGWGGGGGVKGFSLPRVRFQEYFCPKQDPLRHPYTQTWVKFPSPLHWVSNFCPKLCCVHSPQYCGRLAWVLHPLHLKRGLIDKLFISLSLQLKLSSKATKLILNTPRRSKTANKPWSPAKDLKEKSSGEATSLTASMAAETAGLVLDVILSHFFESKTSQINKTHS